MSRITDRMELGFFPLQDPTGETNGRPISQRQSLGGARIAKIPAADDSGGTLLEVAREDGLGTLGDIHPWLFWQTRERAQRGMGAWAQAFGAMVVDADPYYGTNAVQPLRDGEWHNDVRFKRKPTGAPEGLSRFPAGALVIVVPGTAEEAQHDLAMWADNRLVAPHANGPGEMGTLVVDLGPPGKLCMSNAEEPGMGGRHARLQTLMRVVAMPENGALADLGAPGNVLALNFARTGADGIPGFGAIFAPVIGGGPITGGGPQGSPGSEDEGNGESSWNAVSRGRSSGSSDNGGDTFGSSLPGSGTDEKTPRSFGLFRRQKTGGHGVALLEATAGGGPIHAGSAVDKHNLGVDADGHSVGSAHISTGALFFRDHDQDGPLQFGGGYPHPPGWPLRARTHLSWDGGSQHWHVRGLKAGLWRWWTEVPFYAPTPTTGGRPRPPGGPTTGGPPTGGPPTGGPPTGGPPTGGPPPPGGPTTGGPTTGGRGGGGRGGPSTGGRGPGRVIMPGPPIFPGGGRERTRRVGKGYPVGGDGDAPGDLPGGTDGPTTGGGMCTESDYAEMQSADGAGTSSFLNYGPDGASMFQLAMLGNGERVAMISSTIGAGGQTNSTWRDVREDLGRWSGQDPWTRLQETVPGLIEFVGGAATGLVGAYVIHHPLHESFAAMSFRPQLTIARYPNFERNPQLHAGMIETDERVRPHAVTMRAWGAQEQGEWDYTQRPEVSRARGGTVNGGVMFCPPRFEMEDYLEVGGSTLDVDDLTSDAATTGYVLFAPGVRMALGKPASTGGLQTGGIVFRQATPAAYNALLIEQDGIELIRAYQLSGVPHVTFSGAVIDFEEGTAVPVA